MTKNGNREEPLPPLFFWSRWPARRAARSPPAAHPPNQGPGPRRRYPRSPGCRCPGPTTSTYFELDEPDEPVARDQRGHRLLQPTGGNGQGGDDGADMAGFRSYGHSKDHRDDLPQVVVGMAVTRRGIPVRVWCWPGSTSDQVLIRQVKQDLRDWTLARVIWVADRGLASAENRRWLRRGDHHYIIGERLRSGSAEASAALQRQGRYQQVADNLRVKEVRIADHERFVICYNPEQADPTLVEKTDWSVEGGYAATQRLLHRDPGITALFAHNDLIAIGVLAALHDWSLVVPDDVAVVGCDDLPLVARTIPPLTTVRIPFYETGERAVGLLLDLSAGRREVPDRVLLPVELVVRSSCGATGRNARNP